MAFATTAAMLLLMFASLAEATDPAVEFAWFTAQKGQSCEEGCLALGQGECDSQGFQYTGTIDAFNKIKGTMTCVSSNLTMRLKSET
jgi:hypothetical protein